MSPVKEEVVAEEWRLSVLMMTEMLRVELYLLTEVQPYSCCL